MSYNGHESRNQWNVSLWISNDEGLYNMTKDLLRRSRTKEEAAERMLEELNEMGITKTPDGVPYTKTAIRKALSDL